MPERAAPAGEPEPALSLSMGRLSPQGLLQIRAQHLIAILLPVPEDDRRGTLALAFFFHVNAERGPLLQRQLLYRKSFERQVDQQELGLRFAGTPRLRPYTVNNQQRNPLALRLIRGKSGRHFDVAKTLKTVIRIGHEKAEFRLVSQRILASGNHNKVIHAVAIKIAGELRRSRQQRAVIAKLLMHILIGYRRHRSLGGRWRRRGLLLVVSERSRPGKDYKQDN